MLMMNLRMGKNVISVTLTVTFFLTSCLESFKNCWSTGSIYSLQGILQKLLATVMDRKACQNAQCTKYWEGQVTMTEGHIRFYSTLSANDKNLNLQLTVLSSLKVDSNGWIKQVFTSIDPPVYKTWSSRWQSPIRAFINLCQITDPGNILHNSRVRVQYWW